MRKKFEREIFLAEMQTTLLNTYAPKLIATIRKALRERPKENDQLNAVEEIAGPKPEIPREYDQNQILKGGGGFWVDTQVCGSRSQEIPSRLCAREYKTKM